MRCFRILLQLFQVHPAGTELDVRSRKCGSHWWLTEKGMESYKSISDGLSGAAMAEHHPNCDMEADTSCRDMSGWYRTSGLGIDPITLNGPVSAVRSPFHSQNLVWPFMLIYIRGPSHKNQFYQLMGPFRSWKKSLNNITVNINGREALL